MADIDYSDDLAEYILTERLKPWQSERVTLEAKWERNRQAYTADKTDLWGKHPDAADWESDYFGRTTHQKVIAAYSIMIDMLVKGGKVTFELDHPLADVRMAQASLPFDAATLEQIREGMTNLINGQLALSNADRAIMKTVLSAALYGEAYAKGKIGMFKVDQGYQPIMPEGLQSLDGVPPEAIQYERSMVELIQPGTCYVPVWDIFRDRTTDDVREMLGFIHRQMVHSHWLRKQVGQPFFLDKPLKDIISQGAKAMEEGADAVSSSSLAPAMRESGSLRRRGQYHEYWGAVPRQVVDAFVRQTKSHEIEIAPSILAELDSEGETDMVEILAGICNNKIVRFATTEIEERPLFYASFEQTLDEMAPMSVADNVDDDQKLRNETTRTFIDNKKLAGSVITATKSRFLRDGKVGAVRPGLNVEVSEECDDVRQAFQQIIVADVGESLMSLLSLADEMADADSMVPKIAQGMQVKKDATAYELSQQMESSGKYIGAGIKQHDEGIIEPMINWYYRFNMDDPDCPVPKAPFRGKATGFKTYELQRSRVDGINRYLQTVLLHPELAKHTRFRHICEQIVKQLDMDEDRALLSPEEVQQADEAGAAAAQAEATRVAAETEKIHAETELARAQAGKAESEGAAKLSDAATSKAAFLRGDKAPSAKPSPSPQSAQHQEAKPDAGTQP